MAGLFDPTQPEGTVELVSAPGGMRAGVLEQAQEPLYAGPKAAPVTSLTLEQAEAERAAIRGQGSVPTAAPATPRGAVPVTSLTLEQAQAERAQMQGMSSSAAWDQALGEIRTLPETPHVDVGTEIAPTTPASANPYMPQEAPLEPATSPPEMALEMLPLGRAARLGEQMVGPAVKRVAPWLAEQAPGMVQRFGQGVGLDLASKAEQLPQLLPSQVTGVPQMTPGQILTPGLPDALNVVAPEVLHRTLNLPRMALGYTRAGRAILAAEEANQKAGEQWKAKVADMSAVHQDDLATLEAKAQKATDDALRAYHQEGQQTYDAALSDAYQASREYQDAVRAYTQAEQGQAAGVLSAQRLADPSGRYGPDVPSRVLYGKLKDVAGEAATSSAPAKQVVRDIAQEMAENGSVMPSSELAEIARRINALPETTDVAHLHALLKDLGPLTGVRHGPTRGMAQRLMSGVHDSIEAGAKAGTVTGEASELLYAARRAYHNEKSLETLQEILDTRTKGSPITIDTENRVVINPHTLLLQIENKLSKTSGPDRLFRSGFDAEQLVALRKELGEMLKIQDIPGTRPVPPDAAPLPGGAPFRPPPEPVTPDYQRGPNYQPGPPTEPTLTLGRGGRQGFELMPFLIGLSTGHGWKSAAVSGGLAAWDAFSYGLAKLLLTPRGREVALRYMQGSTPVPPEMTAAIAAVGQAAWANRQGNTRAPVPRR